MPLIKRRDRVKREPFRDAILFVIICEGGEREPNYFNYFDRLSSKIKVNAIGAKNNKSAPKHLQKTALDYISNNEETDGGLIEIWIVLDIDRWEISAIHETKRICKENEINLAISNPCFEVWLNFHFSPNQPSAKIDECSTWKSFIDNYTPFDYDTLPSLLETGIINSQKDCNENGYLPEPGSTQVFRLGERILPLIEKEL